MKALSLLGVVALLLCGNAQACLLQESENNNNESGADGPLCSGVPVQASIGSRTDQDWFYFDTNATGDITVSLSHDNNDDFDWFLYRASGSYIASGQSSANPETGSYVASPAGPHYIKVTRYSGTGNYQLTVNFSGATGGGGTDPDPEPENCNYGSRPSKPGGLSATLLGSSNDVCVSLTNPAVLLMGGGADVDAAFANRINPHIKGGNVVVLRTSGTAAYNDYLQGLTNAASVETLIVNTRTKANSDYVDWAIRSAEFVFIAGGDQSDYLNQWLGTKVQDALMHVYNKGGAVGGTSAGNHVLGEFIYDPDGVLGAISSEAVTDFCHETVNISTNFLNIPLLDGIITDTHFKQRDRMGRSAVFQAKLGSSGRVVAVSEATSLFVTADGNGVVDGSHEVYLLRADSQTQYQQTSCGQPVIINNLLRYKLLPGQSYNLLNNSTAVSPSRLSINGNNSNFYNPSNPY
ncbi:Type 1 glutamine amidotransferase-like domain-containing protein [Arsukibacterium indicum]|uniref:Type 1 glutamine amidotransferase-like domain-containing protein n=1 Tax=Arsukibacterium indicum TaxID=2848612 RepID=A0ABS6MQA9_9GAMM|nr:Type 1 glutamine amidotransferase-like domain-containing protein [Arsukibacterium indicum]MBV2130979.1 Type 1 glutamine amidotransferase-like domain-containing protein [Arsukibacterium indicum]